MLFAIFLKCQDVSSHQQNKESIIVKFCYSRLYFEIVGPKIVSCRLVLQMASTWRET